MHGDVSMEGHSFSHADHADRSSEALGRQQVSVSTSVIHLAPGQTALAERRSHVVSSPGCEGQPSLPTFSRSNVQIILDVDEQRLFDVFVRTVDAFRSGHIHLHEHEANGNDIASAAARLEVRVAGGWVRDKLLGLQTHDVDIAVNTLTGFQFATLVHRYLALQQEHTNDSELVGSNHSLVSAGRIGVIAANPAQSKHLETATMKVCGIEVDMCNLRAQEIYEAHSRIPTIRESFGSPLEDAERRDFTVNALFYNLQTRLVEDWTRKGIQDLLGCKLVTPLDPVRTFRDDPLRVLRAIRFAVRYNFQLDASLESAAQDQEIHRALHIKVSRERVGKELEGMLTGKGANPISALKLISRLKLAGSVFALPVEGQGNITNVSGFIGDQLYQNQGSGESAEARRIREAGWEESLSLLDILEPVWKSHNETAASIDQGTIGAATAINHRLLPLATFLLPFRKLMHDDRKKKTKQYRAVSYVFREGLKFKNEDSQAITVMMETVDEMADFLTSQSREAGSVCRLEAGLLLRAARENWVTCLLLATVLKLRQQEQGIDLTTSYLDSDNGNDSLKKLRERLRRSVEEEASNQPQTNWIEVCNRTYLSVLQLGLDKCWKTRPLMDGAAVIRALDLPWGPAVGEYLDEQMKWMLLNPDGTREDCEAHLKSVKLHLEQAATDSVSTKE